LKHKLGKFFAMMANCYRVEEGGGSGGSAASFPYLHISGIPKGCRVSVGAEECRAIVEDLGCIDEPGTKFDVSSPEEVVEILVSAS
jgi:hypothetical protein